MRKGDLVQVKPGCGDEGRFGVLMHDAGTPFTHCMVLFPEGMMEINRYWLERISADDSRVSENESVYNGLVNQGDKDDSQ